MIEAKICKTNNLSSSYFSRLSALASLLFLINVNSVVADESADNLFDLSLEELMNVNVTVTTGTTGQDISILTSSTAVTVITEKSIARQAPFGTADSLKSVPGFYVQESGGQTSNSIGVRGLPASQHFEFISVHEDGLSVNYERYMADAIQRYDIGIARIEATRGGTSGVLTTNGAAAIVNFITKKGREEQGTIKVTLADYDNIRTDFYWGKPINKNWLLAISGYHHNGDTPRKTGLDVEHGGQFRGIVTKLFTDGEVSFTYKHINENNSFVLPLPLFRETGGDLQEITGFDLSHGNTTSRNNRKTSILFADGSKVETDTLEGADVKGDTYTINVDFDIGNQWNFRHASRLTNFVRNFNGLWTGSVGNISIMDAENYFDDDIDFGGGYGSVGDFYASYPAASRCFQYTHSKELICHGDSNFDEIGRNGLVQILNALNEPIKRKQIISDSRFIWSIPNNSLSFGMLYVNIDHQRALQTSLFLSEVTSNNAQVLDIVAVDSSGNVQAYLSDNGVIKHGQWRGNDDMQVTSYSFYINDEYQYNNALRIDAGLRYEDVTYKATSLSGLGDRFMVAGAFDGNGQDIDNVLANNFATLQFGSGDISKHTSKYHDVAWSLGFNYLLTDTLATYGKFAYGFQTPRADRISDIVINGVDTPLSEMEFIDLGIRYSGQTINSSTSLSYTHFDNYLTGGVGFDSSGSEILNESEINVYGIEFELSWLATHWLSVEASGVLQNAELDALSNPAIQFWQGNQPARMPDKQIRITPTFHVTNDLDVYLTYQYVGKRFGANDNIVEFPNCGILDVGASYNITRSLLAQINGRNVTNEICYNEGNPRASSAENELAYGFARPIVGKTWLLSLIYEF